MGTAVIRAFGVDAGSTTTKIVGVDAEGELRWRRIEPTEPRGAEQTERLILDARAATGAGGEVPVAATGYGRNLVRGAGRTMTEITCHARGVVRALRHGGTLVDIGGQDSKVIVIGPAGEVLDFTMNDKCAAGTGRFLENTGRRLDVPVERLGSVALESEAEVSISNTCTVFAESEIVSLLAQGTAVGPILKGLHRALARRILSMIRGVGLKPPLMLSGGVVQNPAIRKMLEEGTGEAGRLPNHPQFMGAYGAALLALGSAPGEPSARRAPSQ